MKINNLEELQLTLSEMISRMESEEFNLAMLYPYVDYSKYSKDKARDTVAKILSEYLDVNVEYFRTLDHSKLYYYVRGIKSLVDEITK